MVASTDAGRVRVLSLCSGYGGLDLAVAGVFGGVVAAHADPDPDASRVLARHWPGVANLGDITALTSADWSALGRVDVLCAGYPCQPESAAGHGRGTDDPRWIWPDIARGLDLLRPRWVVLENVAAHLARSFPVVLADLAALGYDAVWKVTRACDIGAAHRRARLFVLAWYTGHPVSGGLRAWDDDLFGPVAFADRLPSPGLLAGGRVRAWTLSSLSDGTTTAGVLLPTPRASDGHGIGTHGRGGADLRTTVAALLPTPAARDFRSGESNILTRNARPLPEVVVNLLPTPRASEQENRQTKVSPSQAAGRHGRSLAAEACTLLPTPRASDGTHGGPGMRGSSGDVALPSAVTGTWGRYAAAVTRHATVSGRPAPEPTEPGGKTGRRLAPRFVEWLMMLPDGWVTATPDITRNVALRLLGNGVVPAQAANALAVLAAAVPAAPSADPAGRR